MALSARDISYIKEGLLEVYEEMFSTESIRFLLYNGTLNPDDSSVYEDLGDKSFSPAYSLSGGVRIVAGGEEWNPDGLYQNGDARISIPTLSFTNAGMTIPADEEIWLKSRIQYLGDTYRIIKIDRNTILNDTVMMYVFQGRKVFGASNVPSEIPSEGDDE